ncbi:MAG TPA: SH3 domain-containing protein [Candidatus Dormibacteraeota bacterium]|nr:SH3 domain-containing protein [Candidatus Dormibacteraeota bacterium]
MRKILLGLLLVSVVGTGVYLHRRKKQRVEIGFAANRGVTVWDTIAAVREPIGTLDYGARLEVLQRFEDNVKIRTANGMVGWINESNLLTSEFWDKTKQLDRQTEKMPVEAVGHTAVLSNLHIAPGRDAPRIRQLGKMVPVEMFQRQPMDVPGAAVQQVDQTESASAGEGIRKEDWWLVRAHLPDKTTVSGWLLGRFVQLDLPEALYDYASSADMHPIAWFQLDQVPSGNGNMEPQYLLVGTRGSEGQPCDFTLLRVYTWSKAKQQYETAYVESGVCGELPVRVKTLSADSAAFSFEDRSTGTPAEAVYRLEETIVRRQKIADARNESRKRIHG